MGPTANMKELARVEIMPGAGGGEENRDWIDVEENEHDIDARLHRGLRAKDRACCVRRSESPHSGFGLIGRPDGAITAFRALEGLVEPQTGH